MALGIRSNYFPLIPLEPTSFLENILYSKISYTLLNLGKWAAIHFSK